MIASRFIWRCKKLDRLYLCIMKFTILFFIISLASISLAQTARKMPDACALISSAEINTLLGTVVKQNESTAPGVHCPHRSADNAVEVVIQYTGFSDSATARTMLKLNADGNKTQIANGNVAATAYTSFENFEPGGLGANYMTGNNEIRGPLVRLQFALGKYLVTFDTGGIPIESVKKSLPEIYSAIKKHSGL